MAEFPLPTRHTHPYDVIWDKNGELWTGGMTTDRVVRLDPKTSQTSSTSCRATPTCAACSWTTRPPADLLGRQQSRRVDRQGRAAGLIAPAI